MRFSHLIRLLLWAGLLVAGSELSEARADRITLPSLLDEMIDRELVARWPEPAYTCRQFSSYDRASVSVHQPGWFANCDWSHFGTGSEDYYGYAWFDLEIWHWRQTTMAFAGTTHWYARSGATCNVAPAPQLARQRIPQAESPTPKVSGALEAETQWTKFDFESGDLQGWTIKQGKGGKPVSDLENFRTPPHQRYNKQGKYHLSTLERSDGNPDESLAAVIESPIFELSSAYMTFLIGGGDYDDTYLALCGVGGNEILFARGDNSEVMRRVHWERPDLVGRKVFLRLADKVGQQAPWAHITFDDFAVLPPQVALEGKKARQAEQIQRDLAYEKRMRELTADDTLFSRGARRIYR